MTLKQMTVADLNTLFGQSQSGPVPDGAMDGEVLPREHIGVLEHALRFAWQGKIFDAEKRLVTNRLGGALKAIMADVSIGPSWFDGRPCIVLDYSKRSVVAHWIRDELRELRPGQYLGIAYVGNKPLAHFVLSTADADLPAVHYY